ncbi:MAG: hypothetical protein NTY10_01400 [Candidatus Omnitrophica bacterium]|nr:hypothetical protein [Candidatus Omnitrophota bacterium]
MSEKEALRIIEEKRENLERLANALLEKETLTGKEIDEFIAGVTAESANENNQNNGPEKDSAGS